MREIIKKYRIVDTKRSEKKNLEGIVELKPRGRTDRKVTIRNWGNWNNSFWIKFDDYGDKIIVDSGVIEELYNEIQKLKSKPKKED